MIRIEDNSNNFSSKATVSFVNQDDTLDVIYQGEELKEECSVPLNRIRSLEGFESCGDIDSATPDNKNTEALKNNGNVLFSLKDYHSAIDYYKKSLKTLYKQSGVENLTTGSVVLVSMTGSISFECAMISDTNKSKGTFDIVFDNSSMDDEEGILRDRLIPISKSTSDKSLQRSLFMNMTKCNLKLNQTGWAIRHSSLAISLSRMLLNDVISESPEPRTNNATHKLLSDAIYLRAKALLQANRPGFATKVWI